MKPRLTKIGEAWICSGDGRVTLSRSALTAYERWKSGKTDVRLQFKEVK